MTDATNEAEALKPGTPSTAPLQKPWRIGILLARVRKLNTPALRFLVLKMNSLQNSFEFEFLPIDPQSVLIRLLCGRSQVNRDMVRTEVSGFLAGQQVFLQDKIKGFHLTDHSLPAHFVLITLARFSDNWYSMREANLAIAALGNWRRYMAPPSILEFVLTTVLRQSVAFVSPSLSGSVHLGTKGCLFDFNPSLDHVRSQTLQGFICTHCRKALVADGLPGLADELIPVLSKRWLGKSTSPASPAGIVSNLGFGDLFLTKGLKPTFWESLRATLQQEGTEQLIQIIGAIILAGLLLRFGLKGPEKGESSRHTSSGHAEAGLRFST